MGGAAAARQGRMQERIVRTVRNARVVRIVGKPWGAKRATTSKASLWQLQWKLPRGPSLAFVLLFFSTLSASAAALDFDSIAGTRGWIARKEGPLWPLNPKASTQRTGGSIWPRDPEVFTCHRPATNGPTRICSELVEPFGYQCQDFVTYTEDGFILGLQRIRGPRNSTARPHVGAMGGMAQAQDAQSTGDEHTAMGADAAARVPLQTPVLLQHGLLVSAESWLLSEPRSSSLPFQLADAGFEVWLASSRCSPWSSSGTGRAAGGGVFTRRETEENSPKRQEKGEGSAYRQGGGEGSPHRQGGGEGSAYRQRWGKDSPSRRGASVFGRERNKWDWSFDELARYDVPAAVRFVLTATGASSVFYVGHSQGTLILLSSLSMGWLPRQQLKGVYLMAPIAYLGNITSPFAKRAAHIQFDRLVEETGMHHFSFHNELGQRLLGEVCASAMVNCSSLLTEITGPNCCVDPHRVGRFLPWFPLSSSVKNMVHFAQAVRTGTWRMFDYGWRNLLVYGTLRPPLYDPAKIPSVPMAWACGDRDSLSTPDDVAILFGRMRRKPKVLRVPAYAHLDFLLMDTRADANALYADVVEFFRDVLNSSE